MSNPYNSQSLANYNQSPPPDDAAATTSNQVSWAKHIGKIGNPLRDFATAINDEVLSAFGLTFGSAVLPKSSAYTVASGDRGRVITVTNQTTITLLPAATAGTGFPLLIVNTGSAVVTVDGSGAETINGSANLILTPGQGLLITSDGANWSGMRAGGDDLVTSKKTAATSRSGTTTRTADPDLSVSLLSGVWYKVTALIFVTSASSIPDISYSWTTPAGTILGNFRQDAFDTSATPTEDRFAGGWSDNNAIALVSGQTMVIRIDGSIHSDTAGSMSFDWAQDTSSGTDTTVNFGSYLRLERL